MFHRQSLPVLYHLVILEIVDWNGSYMYKQIGMQFKILRPSDRPRSDMYVRVYSLWNSILSHAYWINGVGFV